MTSPNAPRHPDVIAQLSVRRGQEAIAFYAAAFGAVPRHQVGGTTDNPSVVAELGIGDATFWVSDEAPEQGNHSPETLGGASARLLLLVADPDAVIAQAVAAGARLVYGAEEAHGWRLGRVEDPYGHHWEIGTPLVSWPPHRTEPA